MKRIFDVFLSLLALIVLSPIFLIAVVGIKISSPGPVLFRACRVGKDGKLFTMYKFRSMHLNNEKGHIITSRTDNRIFPFGRFLRKCKVDGNVIIGQTTESLVNKGFREVSPIHFSKGRDLFSQYYNDFHAGGEGALAA